MADATTTGTAKKKTTRKPAAKRAQATGSAPVTADHRTEAKSRFNSALEEAKMALDQAENRQRAAQGQLVISRARVTEAAALVSQARASVEPPDAGHPQNQGGSGQGQLRWLVHARN